MSQLVLMLWVPALLLTALALWLLDKLYANLSSEEDDELR